MQNIKMILDAKLSKIVSEIQRSQELHFKLLQLELQPQIEKFESEVRNELEKHTAGHIKEIESLKAERAVTHNMIKFCAGTISFFVSFTTILILT
ncbi:uncharacterized protein LOC143856974 isoform X2 [Tasmannia lanceolata]